MRIKLIALATVVAALAIGVAVSSAAFQSSTSLTVNIKKVGAPASLKLEIVNTDSDKVPQPVTAVTIKSTTAKWNGKALPQCASVIPTNAAGTNDASEIRPPCPKGSKVGTGIFAANTGTPGQPIPAQLGTIDGTANLYNYKSTGGESAAMLIELLSDTPVPNAHVYLRVSVARNGTIVARIPKMEELPPPLTNILSPPGGERKVAMASFSTTIKPPRSKKPFFTLKTLKNLNFSVVLDRD